jgi:hypothetical protein
MNSKRVNEIRAALDEITRLRGAYDTDPRLYNALQDAMVTFEDRLQEDVEGIIGDLLAELDKLDAVVEAARAYAANPEAGHTYLRVTQEKFDALRTALAAYEASERGG